MSGHSRPNLISDDDNQSVQMEGTQKAKQKRPQMKKRSAMWNHFTLLEDNPNKCKYNYCGRQYQCHSRGNGITNMRNHILTCPVLSVRKFIFINEKIVILHFTSY